MSKRFLAVVIALAFIAPAGLATASSSGGFEKLAVPDTASVSVSHMETVADTAAGARPNSIEPARASFRPGPVARLLARIDDVLDALRPQESALAVLFEVDTPDRMNAAREREELDLRLRRHRDAPAFRRDA